MEKPKEEVDTLPSINYDPMDVYALMQSAYKVLGTGKTDYDRWIRFNDAHEMKVPAGVRCNELSVVFHLNYTDMDVKYRVDLQGATVRCCGSMDVEKKWRVLQRVSRKGFNMWYTGNIKAH